MIRADGWPSEPRRAGRYAEQAVRVRWLAMEERRCPLSPAYPLLSPRVELSALDHEVLAFWRERDIFARSVEQTAGGPEWVFFEGPPTVNGKPGMHHVETRVFKDVFARFKAAR
ncbi:MAG: class I tRNA ligase family protein [Pseudonocardiaceae bacterium]